MKSILLVLIGIIVHTQVWAAPSEKAVLTHYSDMALALYEDSLLTAKAMQSAVDKLIAQPNTATLAAARAAWKAARVPYQQTEVYRFGNSIVDEWEGKVNAWPLDEGLIDYVAPGYGRSSDINAYYTANIIANKSLTIGGKKIDASTIDKKLLAETLHEIDGVESNVATGYHAIEFLLWGQDLNGTGPGAGNRPASDFNPASCTSGNCERRAAYLKAATDLLVNDLQWMTRQWGAKGAARTSLLNGKPHTGIGAIFTGIGSLTYGELAGERMQLGLMLHDPEEEHDCFSDNTHAAHFYDALGIRNVYTGSYQRSDGRIIKGPALAELVAANHPGIDSDIRQKLETSLQRLQILVDSAEKDGIAYDQLIAAGNAQGNAKVQSAIDALVEFTRATEKAVGALRLTGIVIEGSDSLDDPGKVLTD